MRYLIIPGLFASSILAFGQGVPGNAQQSGIQPTSVDRMTTAQRAQFGCEQTREQIRELLKRKNPLPSDRDSLVSLRDVELVSCLPPLVPLPPSAATHPAAYPLQSMRQNHEGTVILRVDVAADGSVKGDSVYKSSGYSELDRSAMQAARTWRFDAYKGTSVRITVNFSLQR